METIKLKLEKLDYLVQLIISNHEGILSVEELDKQTSFSNV